MVKPGNNQEVLCMKKLLLAILIFVMMGCAPMPYQGGYNNGYYGGQQSTQQVFPNILRSIAIERQRQRQEQERQRQYQYQQQQERQRQYQYQYQQQQQNVPSNCKNVYQGSWMDRYGQLHPRYELRCW